MSPTTVTGARICTTLLSFMSSSFVFAQIASTTDSANSSFLDRREMHSSRSTVAAESQDERKLPQRVSPMTDVHGRPGIVLLVNLKWEVRHPGLAQGMESLLVTTRYLYRVIILAGPSMLVTWVRVPRLVPLLQTLLQFGGVPPHVTDQARARDFVPLLNCLLT